MNKYTCNNCGLVKKNICSDEYQEGFPKNGDISNCAQEHLKDSRSHFRAIASIFHSEGSTSSKLHQYQSLELAIMGEKGK